MRTTKLGNAPESFMMTRIVQRLLAAVVWAAACGSTAIGDILYRDTFTDLSQWTLQASDGVVAEIQNKTSDGPGGLRLRYDFRAGSGFVVVRRKVGVELPENYRLTVRLRGGPPANNFETKLLDPSGENVWWVNQRDHVAGYDWTTERFKKRHFTFAWGPSGGKPLTELGAIEFAVAASNGGQGLIDISEVVLESLPAPAVRSGVIAVSKANGDVDAAAVERVFERGGAPIRWKPQGEQPELVLDLGKTREFGGAVGVFAKDKRPKNVQLDVSSDGMNWETGGTCAIAPSGHFYLPIRDAEGSYVRLRIGSAPDGAELENIELAPLAFGATMNGTFERIAADQPRGSYPQYFGPEQQYWTVVGVADDKNEALLSADGTIEVDKEWFSLEPLLQRENGELLTWANAEISQELADGYLPIPSVTRKYQGLTLRIDAFAFGEAGASALGARYTLRNTGNERQRGRMLLAVRPLQVNPPWQDLKTSGGYAKVDWVWPARGQLDVVQNLPDKTKSVQVLGAGVTMHASPFELGDAALRVAAGELPQGEEKLKEPWRARSGVIVCAYDLAPGAESVWGTVTPFHGFFSHAIDGGPATKTPYDITLARLQTLEAETAEWWRKELNHVQISVPGDRALENTFRTAQAHMLINRDGPAIQPGSRTYERSWIRDGCLTSSALLATGHADRVREFINWYAPYQYPSGKVPCVVDKRGPDPVPENDSHGQLLYLLYKYYLFTHDTATLEKNYPHVQKAVEYIKSIRAQRLTDEYKSATGLKHAMHGLVPESISHEGYSAKPMHSYWDDFFVEKGLQDAASIAGVLGRTTDRVEYAKLASDFRSSVLQSINESTAFHKIDYIPGCVELGDFDGTSTTIALWPCGGEAWLPQDKLKRTFEKFFEFGQGRIGGTVKYNEYTPYEWRVVGAMIRLGGLDRGKDAALWRERAQTLADFYMKDRRPAAWNQWAEVVCHDPANPRFIGDMPHTWVASDFLNSVRAMFVYEDEVDKALVIGAGMKPEWSKGEGVSIGSWPTEYGVLSYKVWREGATLRIKYDFAGKLPDGGIVISPNLLPGFSGAFLNGKPLMTIEGDLLRVRETRGELALIISMH